MYLLWRGRDTFNNNVVVCAIALALSCGMTGYMARETWNAIGSARVLMRNFYGALVVYDEESSGDMGPVRVLRHGTINHGEQFIWPQNLRHATTYYAEKSGLGLALRSLRQEGNINVGSIGLGAGTTAVYARPGDHYFFYDINPNVLKIATTQFSFLLHCYGSHDVILGDARLSLENELKQGINHKFDLLSVDAFSGDAIPVHLLTREAYKIYWQHLRLATVVLARATSQISTCRWPPELPSQRQPMANRPWRSISMATTTEKKPPPNGCWSHRGRVFSKEMRSSR